jgi:hypothetical protein
MSDPTFAKLLSLYGFFNAVLILFFGDEPSFSPSPLPTTPNKNWERFSTAEKNEPTSGKV